jgi:OOP family OmpA-OmpF porin
MKLKTQLAAACVVAFAAVSAQAQVAGTGLYVGGSVGQSKWRGDDLPGLDTSKTGGKVYGGYEFTPNFALELGWVELGKFNTDGASVKANGPFLDAVGKVPFAAGWSGLARAGLFQGKLERNVFGFNDDDNGTGYKLGLGVQYDLTQNAAIRTEYERYRFKAFDTKPDTDLLSVGFNFRF